MSSPNLSLILQFADQFKDPLVAAELQQLISAIQQWANGVTGIGQWIDAPFSVALFSTNSTGSITPKKDRPYVFQYLLIGDMLLLQVAAKFVVNNGTTTEIRLRLPNGLVLNPYENISDGDQAGDAGIFNGGGVSGVTGLFADVTNNCISVQRADGSLAAGFPTATVFIRASMSVRVRPRSIVA